ncbi:Serine/threonine-protein kinase tel1 [Lasiodiplodia hormozganensis]|uniref:Serine/threonine-protein kinase tel1 n=1 Tax=Lasiodiplodia hormozganensis TaxID=869390 RepID=A0AA39Z5U9_9PEZI|nr:Serine/threonine-protein kinase tel1 [Lasiodiplodia hormozganensis]
MADPDDNHHLHDVRAAIKRLPTAANIGDCQKREDEAKFELTKRVTKPGLTDKDYHDILTRFAQENLDQRSLWLHAKPSKTGSGKRPKAQRIMMSCAECMRHTVELGLLTIRYKTMRALVDHILQALPDPSGSGYIDPLVPGYIKCLRLVLQHPPHVEHLPVKESSATMKFCLEAFTALAPETQPPGATKRYATPAMTPDPSGEAPARREGASSQRNASSSHAAVDDLLGTYSPHAERATD